MLSYFPVIIPVVFFIIVFWAFLKKQKVLSYRIAFLSASLVWGALLTAMTEFLSLFNSMGRSEILLLWILSSVLVLIYLIRVSSVKNKIYLHLSWIEVFRSEKWILVGILFIVALVGFVALVSPPNNADSMAYHMSRVVHWIQNRNVEHYPTYQIRQLFMSPWAEFAIMHFQILSKSDRFVNLIQWFSMVGCLLGVSLLAKQLGADPRGQILSVVVAATIPMGILQSSSTQNDYVASFWLVCFTNYVFYLKKNEDFMLSLAVGVSLGLALLTKSTAYIYALPFMIWLSFWFISTHRVRGFWSVILIGGMAIIINLGHYTRNYDLFNNPLSPIQGHYVNQVFTPSSISSNIIRNFALHIGTPSNSVNNLLQDNIIKIHKLLGIDMSDSRTTLGNMPFQVGFWLHEDLAGNPLHLILIIVSMFFILLKRKEQVDSVKYLICLVAGFILFNIYLKWQPWGSRLQLPLFVLWSPLVGMSLSSINGGKFHRLSITVLFLSALPYLLMNQSRPILRRDSIVVTSRTMLYFTNNPRLAEPYLDIAKYILKSRCANVGFNTITWEYPFWVLLDHGSGRSVRLEHVNVRNVSRKVYGKYPFSDFKPCAVVVENQDPPDEIHVGNTTYYKTMFKPPFSVFVQK